MEWTRGYRVFIGTSVQIPNGVSGFFSGAFAVFRGAGKIISDAELRKLAVIPLLITGALYFVLLVLAIFFADDLLGYLWPQPPEGALRYLWYVLLPFVFAAVLAPFLLLFSSVAEAIGGPFYDRMALRVLSEYSIAGREPGLLRGTVPDFFRSLALAAIGGVCALLGLIPVVGIAFAVAGGVIACIGFAWSAMNSALMVTGLDLGARVRFVFRSFTAMAGIGAVVMASLLVPFLGLLALPAAVVGATDLYARAFRAG
jgi:CysZ protein